MLKEHSLNCQFYSIQYTKYTVLSVHSALLSVQHNIRFDISACIISTVLDQSTLFSNQSASAIQGLGYKSEHSCFAGSKVNKSTAEFKELMNWATFKRQIIFKTTKHAAIRCMWLVDYIYQMCQQAEVTQLYLFSLANKSTKQWIGTCHWQSNNIMK